MIKTTRALVVRLLLILGVSYACGPAENASKQAPELPESACSLLTGARDTLRYGRIRASEESGDLSGAQVSLWLDTAGRWWKR